jgi:acyl carrier protein
MSTLETLQDILMREFGLDHGQLAPGAELRTLGIDSLDLLDLLFKIEDRYGISIKNDVPNNLMTIDDVVVYIDGLLARRPDSAAAAGSAQFSTLGGKT